MPTFLRAADELLASLCNGLGLDGSYEEFRRVQRFFLKGWGEHEVPSSPPYLSAIGDDHSPFEYSIAFGTGLTELRLLVEVQGATPCGPANQAAAVELNPRLASTFQANFERFDRIKSLFLTDAPHPPFSLWHAACLSRDGRHDFKVYLNPQVRGAGRASELVREALDRLGMSRAVRVIERITGHPGLSSTPNYFSLDLCDAERARVKVYFQHPNATARHIDEIFTLAPTHRKGDVMEFARAIVGDGGPYRFKAVTSCFSFVEGRDEPKAATFHMPIAHYVPNDAVTVERVARYLSAQGIDPAAYLRAVQSFAMRALDDGAGIQSYASFRREPSGIRFTAYLSPELFRERQCPSQLRMKVASVRPTAENASEHADEHPSARRR